MLGNPPTVPYQIQEDTPGFYWAWLAVISCGLVLFALMVAPASAETVSGTLGSAGWEQIFINSSQNFIGSSLLPVSGIYVPDMPSAGSPKTLLVYSNTFQTNLYSFTTDAGAPASASTDVNIYVAANTTANASGFLAYPQRLIGTGTLGYQRAMNGATPPAETVGSFVYLTISSWIPGNETGAQELALYYSQSALYNMKVQGPNNHVIEPGTGIMFLRTGARLVGDGGGIPYRTIYNKDTGVQATYTATEPEGLGIAGSVSKTSGTGQAFIFNASGATVLTSESQISGSRFNFTILPEPIIIGIRSPSGTYYNSSVLFSGISPEPTTVPTTVPTVIPTANPYNPPLPAGYVRSMAECVDLGSNRISGCNIQLLDVENGSWSNKTDSWGYWFIDTLTGHTIDSYGDKTGYNSASVLGRGASGSSMIELFLTATDVPTSPGGYVNFFVLTNDYETGAPLDADLEIRDSKEGYTEITRTGSDGKVMVLMSNLTMIYFTAEAPGYIPTSATKTTTAFGPDTVRIELHRATVPTTPEPTATPPGWTPTTTIDPHGQPGDPGYANAKGQQIMDLVAENGYDIAELCILVTILGLLGIRLGK